MGMIHAEITLKNAAAVSNAHRGRIKADEIPQVTVKALVDTGTDDLVIDEKIREQLDLFIENSGYVTLADGSKIEFQETEPVGIYWNDRVTVSRATVLPYADEVLLGALPLEGMDLMIQPKTQTLVGVHGAKAMRRA
jgi:clan AA aspartic protease